MKIPAIVLLEGWGAAGKGTLASSLISELDPRGYKVYSMAAPTAEEKRFPWMKRYWQKVPQYGQMVFLDHSWYREVSIALMEGEASREEAEDRLSDILDFERQLADDGYVLVKLFLHITKKEQKKRFKHLTEKNATSWRVTKADHHQHKHYEEYFELFDEMLEKTDRPGARWTVLDAMDDDTAKQKAYQTLVAALEKAIAKKEQPAGPAAADESKPDFRKVQTVPIHMLGETDLSLFIQTEDYKKELKECQERLFLLHNKLYQQKIPVVLVYEGWDAAGKGGNIRRLARGLDPRGYEVIPISAPAQAEKEHPFLWRFWMNLPKDGHIAVFDRSWYGRVMVERIEGFCREDEWRRAYDEINRFELELNQRGAIVEKFFLHIDKEEQLNRFHDRENTPEKRYKITDEDWRNREKWDAYETAVNEMLQKTNTAYAPWTVVESNSKHYARIKVLKTVIRAVEERLS